MAQTVQVARRVRGFQLAPLLRWVVLVGGILVLLAVSQSILQLDTFPEAWNLGLRGVMNGFKRWVVVNRNTHWIFLFFFEPLSDVIDFGLRRVEDFLLWLPWPVVVLSFFLLAYKLSGSRLAWLTTACLIPMGLFGLWAESMQTLALMVMAVLFALVLGIPVGIWSARSDRLETLLRPLLDAMQTMPAFVYLIPVLLFFGVARVPSIIATVIYALPPAIRLTSLGIRSVSEDVLEASDAFGSTERQRLRKVQLPLAMPTIMVGVNQTIMMALSIVVIAALIGAGGLGDVVLKSLRRLRVGAALEAGLAIVFLAILLDRLSTALSQRRPGDEISRDLQALQLGARQGRAWLGSLRERLRSALAAIQGMAGRYVDGVGRLLQGRSRFLAAQKDWVAGLIVLAALTALLRLASVGTFPGAIRVDVGGLVDALVQWMQVNLYDIGGSGIGTGPLRDFLIIRVFQPLTHFLVDQLPWVVVAFLFIFGAYVAEGWRLALTVAALTLLIGFFGMWAFAMDTLGQTLVAVLICILAGIPLGIWAARKDQVERALRPILDFLQTIPIFVYLVPVIMLFGTGSVAGLIASVLYAVVPVIRLTSAGIRGVDPTVRESAAAFGSTAWQTLLKVEIPLAFPTIMLGINQTIMMVLAMVIIAGLVGATGLGLEVYQGFANDSLGRSVEAGLAIVLLAIIIDRITQRFAQNAADAANID